MSSELRRFGYWRGEWERNKSLPHPRDFVDHDWDPEERAFVIGRLKIGAGYTFWKGYSGCRMCDLSTNGTQCWTGDGTWIWPQGLAHYVEEHGVRPPQEFVDHLRSWSPELVAELAHHHQRIEEIKNANEEGLYTACSTAGVECEHRPNDLEGKFYCQTKSGNITYGGWFCRKKHDVYLDELREERDRHRVALRGLVTRRWSGGSMTEW